LPSSQHWLLGFEGKDNKRRRIAGTRKRNTTLVEWLQQLRVLESCFFSLETLPRIYQGQSNQKGNLRARASEKQKSMTAGKMRKNNPDGAARQGQEGNPASCVGEIPENR
jgi:hypothetical protein